MAPARHTPQRRGSVGLEKGWKGLETLGVTEARLSRKVEADLLVSRLHQFLICALFRALSHWQWQDSRFGVVSASHVTVDWIGALWAEIG